MTLLTQLGVHLGVIKRVVKTNHTFCPKCPMSEGKAEVVFIASTGEGFCDVECAARLGVTIDLVFRRSTNTVSRLYLEDDSDNTG